MKRKGKAGKILLAFLLMAALVVIIAVSSCAGDDAPAAAAQKSDLILSEIMISNRGAVPDATGAHPDYVELYNAGSEALSLGGYSLTDRETDAWLIPDGTVLESGAYLVIWCTGETVEDALIANFKLSQGDVLRLSDLAGNLIVEMELPSVYAGYTYCYNAATGAWEDMPPSPGYPNTAEGQAAYEQSKELSDTGAAGAVIQTKHNGVYISELMPANRNTLNGPDGTSCDWIELYNSTAAPVDLGNCGISDDLTNPYKFTFPAGVVIDPYGYLVLYCSPSSADGYICVDFNLSSGGESVVLTDAAGGILDTVEFPAMAKDISFARAVGADGAFDPNAVFTENASPSPGFENSAAGATAFQQQENPDLGVHDVRLNEVLSNGYSWVLNSSNRPEDRDLGAWIELYNQSDTEVTLTGFTLSDDPASPAKWVFPDGTSIAGKGYLVLYLKGSLPLEGTDAGSVTAEMTLRTVSFDIAGEGETLSLYNADSALIDRVSVPESRACVSYGRDQNGDWAYFDSPTQGAANTTGIRGIAATPVLSVASGLYHEQQQVSIEVPEGCFVAYTLDCTTPTASSQRYTGTPLTVSQNTVIRARAFSESNTLLPSDTASNTYLIVTGEQTVNAHDTTLPIIFLVTDPDNLFSTSYGIHVLGDAYEGQGNPTDWKNTGDEKALGANFNQRGREWERLTHFTYTSAGGASVEYETDAMLRVFGAFSRWKGMKGFALIARKGYGDSSFQYPFFANRPFDSYKSLLLRCSAMDNAISRIRDVLVHGLVEDSGIDMANQAYVQCLVYINGEYWAVYNLREKVSKHFIAQHFGVTDKDTIDVLRGNGDKQAYIVAGGQDGLTDYRDLIQYCKDHDCDLSSAEAYAHVCSQVDVENFAMYCALEIIVGNTDTGNIKFWRSSELDNKWRWLIYDFDWAMNRDDGQDRDTSTGFRRDFFFRYFDERGHGAARGFSTVLGRSLLQNNEFVEIFLNACAVMYNDVFTPEKISAKVDELMAPIAEEMKWDNKKWELTYDYWISNCSYLKEYANGYGPFFLKYCKEFINEYTDYSLTDDKMIQLFGTAG